MKAKDYLNKKLVPDPIKGKPIVCPCCGKFIGYDKDFMFMVIQRPGIVCPDCDEIVIPCSNITNII
jgi:hypothetical protein